MTDTAAPLRKERPTTDPADFEAIGLNPISAKYYAARNVVIAERNAKIEATRVAAEAECQERLTALREQYDADWAAAREAQR